MKIVALAGGVGGARLADGLTQIIPAEDFTIIVNTGDDFEHFGLRICPDLDTVCYTLAGIANPVTGWGIVEESWVVMESIERLGGAEWFRLGDRDLGTHLERTRRLNSGESLSEVTRNFCSAWGIAAQILPMSDYPIPTTVITEEGELPFQDYFVRRKCEPKVLGFRFEGAVEAKPAKGVINSIQQAAILIICPSNPWVSIDPILSVSGIKEAILNRSQRTGQMKVIAVSPIIGGKAVKGPVVKMYQELGIAPSAFNVARHYHGLIHGFVFDSLDQKLESQIQNLGLATLCTDTLMKNRQGRKRLAGEIMNFYHYLLSDNI